MKQRNFRNWGIRRDRAYWNGVIQGIALAALIVALVVWADG